MNLPPLAPSRLLTALTLGLACCGATLAQTVACDQGIVRLPDRTGTVQICSAMAAQVPALSKQLGEAVKLLGNQQQQIRELTRLVRAVNGSSAGLDAARQAQLLKSLSAELQRAQQRGPDATRKTVEDLGEQFEGLRDQLTQSLSQPASAAATNEALRGKLGDSIAQLELRSATRQLDEMGERLKQVQADVGAVKQGVTQANEKLDKLASAIDPANPSDRCASLECAVMGSASVATVQKLVQSGARLPAVPQMAGMFVMEVVSRAPADREAVLSLLLQAGLDPAVRMMPQVSDVRRLSPHGKQLALAVLFRLTPGSSPAQTGSELEAWNKLATCLSMGNDGVRLSELAAMWGDDALLRQARALSFAPPRPELSCRSIRSNGPAATIAIAVEPSGKATVSLR